MENKLMNGIRSFRRKSAEKSLYAFAKYYLKHHLKLSPSEAHHEIYALLEDIMAHRGKRAAIAAPRGFGKSTLITLFYIIYAICYLKERYIIILSDTASQAEQILENIKKELTENEKLRADFPEVFEKDGRPKPPRWTQSQIETLNGVKVQALGAGQKPRGRRYGKYRPTLIIADDIETAENVATELSRDKTKGWLTSTVLMLGDENTNFIFLGTLYHPLCLLGEYLNPDFNREWIKKIYKVMKSDPRHPELSAQWSDIYNNRKDYKGQRGPTAAKVFYHDNKGQIDDGIGLLWPEKWSHYDLMIQREENHLSFSCELMNEPYDLRTAVFNVEKFHYWDKKFSSLAELLSARQGMLEFYGSCDPSLGMDATKGDYSAIIIAARDIETANVYVIEADIRRMTPPETIVRIVDLCRTYMPVTFFIETNNFQQLMCAELERELGKQCIYTPIQSITHTSDSNKMNRIHALDLLINNGTIQFSLTQKRLLDQFRSFPSGQHDDGPDALEMLVSNIRQQPTVMINPVFCEKLNSVQSSVLRGVPDMRGIDHPHVYNWDDGDNKEPPLKSGGPVSYGW